MSKTDDLEKIDIPWKMVLIFLILAAAVVLALPGFEWMNYLLLQNKLEDLAVRKTQNIDLDSTTPEEWLHRVQGKHDNTFLDFGSDEDRSEDVFYYVHGVCSESNCEEILYKKWTREVSLPADLPTDELQPWSNETCAEIYEDNKSVAAGAIIYKGKEPFALLCSVSRKDP